VDFAHVQDFRMTVTRAAAALRAMDEVAARVRPAPGKWSPQEIIGHLIDSASNNHQRFVRAQSRDDLRFDGYEQTAWVRVQDYQSAPWAELVTLWELFNLHIARVMELAPEHERMRPRPDHNLDALAWQTVPASEPATLEYFMRDYIGHLRHHLRQIDPRLAAEPELQRSGSIRVE
jgi:DinB superfamily